MLQECVATLGITVTVRCTSGVHRHACCQVPCTSDHADEGKICPQTTHHKQHHSYASGMPSMQSTALTCLTDIWAAVRTPNACALGTASSFTLNTKADGPAASTECCCIQLLASSWGGWGVLGGVQGPLPCLLQLWQAWPLGPELHRLPARRPSKPCALCHPPLSVSGSHAQPHALSLPPLPCPMSSPFSSLPRLRPLA